ncbi:MAG: phosphohydrolase [Pyrinomonadaceae bacterium]
MKYLIREQFPLVDEILGEREAALNLDLSGYKNHVLRVINYSFAFDEMSPTDEAMLVTATVFHDLGIWTDGTFDYLLPSIAAADAYLMETGQSDRSAHVSQIIREHHKLRPFRADRITEIFRKADLVDVSLGSVRFGLDRSFVKDVRVRFPNNGFHRFLIKTAGAWFIRHPIDPIPVLKW